MKIFYMVCDGGDGSANVHWFKSETYAKRLAVDVEDYYQNEGEVKTLTLPDDTDLSTLGIQFRDED